MTIHPIETIISDAGIRGGQPIIAATALRVSDLVASHLYRGLSPEELAINFGLNLGQVYAALAYYYQHKTEIDAQMQADTLEAEHLLAELAAQKKLMRFD